MRRLGYAPVITGEPISTVIASIASLLGPLMFSFGAPRGNYQKFMRELFPRLLAKAQETGLPVLCYWFGEIIEVTPDGQMRVIGAWPSNQEAIEYWRERGNHDAIIAYEGNGNPQFVTYSPENITPQYPDPAGSGSNPGPIVWPTSTAGATGGITYPGWPGSTGGAGSIGGLLNLSTWQSLLGKGVESGAVTLPGVTSGFLTQYWPWIAGGMIVLILTGDGGRKRRKTK